MKIALRIKTLILLFIFTTYYPIKVDALLVPDLPFLYNFSSVGVVEEKSSPLYTSSPYWWVNSGGQFILQDGRGSTIQGDLLSTSKWRLAYSVANPQDTDNGFHPQNIFRLVSTSKWKDFEQSAYFKIIKNNISESSNRNTSNGLLLFNRYQDQYNLYYTGVRVDGSAIIKKKKDGVYTTLKEVKNIYSGVYDRNSKPNLLPTNEWIGLKSQIANNSDGSVSIKLFLDKGWNNRWNLVAEVTDFSFPITEEGYGGIRTDFMDVKFDNFKISDL